MSRVAIVTGGNQGLGLALVRGLCRLWGDDGIVYLTARHRGRGEAAVEKLEQEGLRPRFGLLDVSEDDSVATFAQLMEQEHGGVDVVLSNAAARISPNTPDKLQVRQFIETNNHGTYRVIKHFGPLLRDGGRFVVIASSFGSLHHLTPSLRSRFDVANASLENIEKVMDDYVQSVESGRDSSEGWPAWINPASKVGQVASMKVMARELAPVAGERDLLITASCPGLIDTEASRPWFADMSHAQSTDQAAVDVLWLVTAPRHEVPYGELVQHRRILPFGS